MRPPPPQREGHPSLWLIDRRQRQLRCALPGLRGLLSAEELTRLAFFRREDDRERFLLGRSALRQLLGAWLDREPRGLALAAGAHGKPSLRRAQGRAAMEFNVAHSGALVVLAFHPSWPVGVDVEQFRPQLAWPPIAHRVLPPATTAWLLQLPEAEGREAFLQEWCQLEATLKAAGTGLAARGRESDGMQARDRFPGLRRWDLQLPSGYFGAVSLLESEPPRPRPGRASQAVA